jgi:hypothetical protein
VADQVAEPHLILFGDSRCCGWLLNQRNRLFDVSDLVALLIESESKKAASR